VDRGTSVPEGTRRYADNSWMVAPGQRGYLDNRRSILICNMVCFYGMGYTREIVLYVVLRICLDNGWSSGSNRENISEVCKPCPWSIGQLLSTTKYGKNAWEE
jgi:hypothetical protein